MRIVGFGTFSVANRAATTGRNPRTGETIQIKASKQPKFKAGSPLKLLLIKLNFSFYNKASFKDAFFKTTICFIEYFYLNFTIVKTYW